MNKHIEFVKEWLADQSSKSQQELDDNYDDAEGGENGFYVVESYDTVTAIIQGAKYGIISGVILSIIMASVIFSLAS